MNMYYLLLVSYHSINYRMSQPGVTGVLCTDKQGLSLSGAYICASVHGICMYNHTHAHTHTHTHTHLSQHMHPCTTHITHTHTHPNTTHNFSLSAQGTLKPELSGLVAGLASKANKLKHGTGADDVPVISVELDTG